MINNDGVCAPLGLSALAGVVDNERVNQRYIVEQQVWIAVFRETDALSWQPFERSVFAQMNDRVCIPSLCIMQPVVQCIIVMCWWQVGDMVNSVRVHTIAARWL